MSINLNKVIFSNRVILGVTAEPTPPTDPYWSDVVLLLTGETLNDSSSFTTTIQQNVGVTTSATEKKFGSSSIRFDASSDYIRYTNSGIKSLIYSAVGSETDMTTPFTIEWFQNQSVTGSVFSTVPDGTKFGFGAVTSFGITRFIDFLSGGGTRTLVEFGTLSNNTWNALAVTFDGSTTRAYLNGTLVDSTNTDKPLVSNSDYGIRFGNGQFGSSLQGYIDEFRFTAGVARYTGSSYTVATEPYPTN